MRKFPFIFTAVSVLCGTAMANPPALEKRSASASFEQAITDQQLHELQGTYRLANGGKLRLSTLDSRLYANLNGRDVGELVATSENNFASKDGAISVRSEPQKEGEEIHLSYNSDLQIAASSFPYERNFGTR